MLSAAGTGSVFPGAFGFTIFNPLDPYQCCDIVSFAVHKNDGSARGGEWPSSHEGRASAPPCFVWCLVGGTHSEVSVPVPKHHLGPVCTELTVN